MKLLDHIEFLIEQHVNSDAGYPQYYLESAREARKKLLLETIAEMLVEQAIERIDL